ncbi:MAG: hypothetical protein KAJ19_08330 [Gammaproteobacteria bacterium]|nr:hypothetical protein [Gammaproteobacteria bacterium]
MTGIYEAGGSNGGVTSGFVWVWHKGNSENPIYSQEYTIDTSIYPSIEFGFDLRRHSGYSSTPQTSLAVHVGGKWYVSKAVFTSSSTAFLTKTFTYDPGKDNWDTLDIATSSRGPTAALDLSGNIKGFGLCSNSQNVGGNCTAEYDDLPARQQRY